MAQTSDVSYAILEDNYQQYLRLGTLRNSNTGLVDAASNLDIFPIIRLITFRPFWSPRWTEV